MVTFSGSPPSSARSHRYEPDRRTDERISAVHQNDPGGLCLPVTGAAVSAYENGNRLPSYEVLVKIANILGTTTDALLGRQGTGRVTLDITDLTPRQRSLVQEMVEEFAAGNRRGDPL